MVQTYIYEGFEFGIFEESGYWFAISRMKHLKFAFEGITHERAIDRAKAAIDHYRAWKPFEKTP
jgi:hypothetical protein